MQQCCVPTMVFIYLPKKFFLGAEALPVIQYPQSLCRLSFVLLHTREPSQMQQEAEALGENQDRGEALAALAIQNLLAVLC